MTPRISPGRRADIGSVNQLVLTIGSRVARTGLPNLFTTMARNRGLFRGWLWFAGRMMPGGTLPRRETELVILRTASLSNCDYELHHHRRLGAATGLSPAEIDRAIAGDLTQCSDRDRALSVATNQLHEHSDLDDATWAELRRHLDEPSAIEFVLLAGHYRMLATFITTLRIETDR